MKVIKYTDFLNESTSNYYPGYSDDGTADSLGKIREKVSRLMNEELTKAEKKVLSYNTSPEVMSQEETLFYQKWMYANMIMTSLQDGFYINKGLVDKAKNYYKETLQSEFINTNKTMKMNVMEVIKEIEKLEPMDNKKYYKPGFMKEYTDMSL